MAQKVRIIGVPMDLGQSRRGVDMGPSALRGAGLQSSIKKLGLQVEDIGNLSVKQPEEMPVGEKRAKYLQEIAETCGDVAAAAEKSLNEGFLPLVLGGDHSIAAGVAAGVTNRQAHLAMEMIADTESMVSLEVVEINPILDEHNRTALLGVELVLSGLGQKIL